MSSTLTYVLILSGLVAIVALSLVIRRQLRDLRAARELQEQQREKSEQSAREHRQYLIDSIRIISSAVIHDEKMTITEGCIRLKVLLDNLAPHLHQHADFAVIQRVYEATKHIPYLADWRALSRVEKARYELQMAQVEAEQGEAVERAMQALQTYPLEQLH